MFVRTRSGIYVPVSYVNDDDMIHILDQIKNARNSRLVDTMKGIGKNMLMKHMIRDLSHYANYVR